ncbi:MAG: hypothetical protein JW850_05090 [Thermoflexales bacterium]|nr:hypothetical protein [Thermoflexales bacterium]
MSTLLFLIVTFIPLVFLEKWIHQHLHGVALLVSRQAQAALYLYALLLFPGVALHELSHWLMAGLLGVRTGRVNLLPEHSPDGHVRLGSVELRQRVDVVRASLIGVAPLLGGSLLVSAIGYLAFDIGQASHALLSGDPTAMSNALWYALHTPDMWLWLYLVFAVANAMLPSSTDRQSWPPVILFIAILALLAWMAGATYPASAQIVLSSLAPALDAALRWLAVVFLFTLAADLPFVLLIAFAEWSVGKLRGQRVYYKED